MAPISLNSSAAAERRTTAAALDQQEEAGSRKTAAAHPHAGGHRLGVDRVQGAGPTIIFVSGHSDSGLIKVTRAMSSSGTFFLGMPVHKT